MAWTPREHFKTIITLTQQTLSQTRILREDMTPKRALLDLQGQWGNYRIIISEIHRPDETKRYAYYVLDANQQMLHGFDNSPDTQTVKLRYGATWKIHRYEEVPHYHEGENLIKLTPHEMTLADFFSWLKQTLPL